MVDTWWEPEEPELPQRCGICGEGELLEGECWAEMYDPTEEGAESVICHPDCGLANGMEVA